MDTHHVAHLGGVFAHADGSVSLIFFWGYISSANSENVCCIQYSFTLPFNFKNTKKTINCSLSSIKKPNF